MKQRIYRLLCLMTALFIMSCECPYLYGESDSEYYRRTGYDRLETFKWRYDGNYITFTQGNTTYQFQITGFLSPELYLRDSRGKYTWAYRRSEECIK